MSFPLSYHVYSLTYFPTIHWFMYFDICLLIIIKIQFAPKWPQYSLTFFLNCVSSQYVHIANMLQMLGVRSWMGPWIFEVHVRRHSESVHQRLIQDFPDGRVLISGEGGRRVLRCASLLFGTLFECLPKTAWIWKKLDQESGTSPTSTLDPPMVAFVLFCRPWIN